MFGDSDFHSLEGSPENARTLNYLREEAYQVRDCFTRYSLQILAVTGAILVAITRFQELVPLVGFMALFPILLLFHVLIMGVHKYGTSNRLLGYELHLQRTAHYSKRDRCHKLFKTVGWEEAMRAWRIIQPSLWNRIYEPSIPTNDRLDASGLDTTQAVHSPNNGRTFISRLLNIFYHGEQSILDKWIAKAVDPKWLKLWLYPVKIKHKLIKQIETKSTNNAGSYFGFWFDQSKALKKYGKDGIVYNAGGYLRTFSLIFLMALTICLCVMGIAVLQVWYYSILAHGIWAVGSFALSVILTCIFPLLVMLVFLVWGNIRSRIQILEAGLQSIHSTAIVWEATTLAHLLALSDLRFYDKEFQRKATMHGYTNAVTLRAKAILGYSANIHEWIDIARLELDGKIQQQDADDASQTIESRLVPQS